MTREDFLAQLDKIRFKLNVTLQVRGELKFFDDYIDELDCLIHSYRVARDTKDKLRGSYGNK